MSDSETNRIELQSFDLFVRIEHIHRHPAASPDNLRTKYALLYKVLEEACHELTSRVSFSFANLFSRLDYICKMKRMTPSDRYAVQTMRRHCNAAIRNDFRPDMTEYLYDLRALACFVAAGFESQIPSSLLPALPPGNRPYKEEHSSYIPYLRASVVSWNDQHIFATTDSDKDPLIDIDYAKGGYNGDLLYLRELLAENLPINLLDIYIDERHCYIPRLVIIHPDYLIDISSLAACFREYGHHPLNHFINKIKPRPNTAAILMGNLAGQFLDDYVNEQKDNPVTYARAINKFFASSALEFCTCPLPADFHAQAQSQMANIRSFIQNVLPHSVSGFDRHKTLLEASFICEQLGLQGRVDMLQKDFKVLIEQKAGKRDEYNRRHKEDHFVQMMLYQGILARNFGERTKGMQTFLLYSKYADGLMMEHFSEALFRESIRLRNRIAANEISFGEGGIASVVSSLNADLLNEQNTDSALWNRFQRPQLEEVIEILKNCTPLEQTYFQRFFTFVSKELVLAKTGGGDNPANGFAGIWHRPLNEKTESGNILLGLTIADKRQSHPNKGYDLIELHIPQQEEDFLPNFRPGDIIIFYAYQNEPDVRRHILMKGNLYAIGENRLTILLRNGQQNKDIIGGNGNETFAIEHDHSDVSSSNSIRGLYAFLSANADRKALLLCQRPPRQNIHRKLNGSYGRFDEIIRKAKQADDYFLLVGPPGTGKTSCALRYMVEEALTDPEASLLLMSYTNRAVDEICSMLTDSGIAEKEPFIRIGHELSCDKRFIPYLLKESLKDCPKLSDIRQKILKTRIIVGTTASISGKTNLFSLKRFTLAIVDEAAQILEPDLIGILSARHGDRNAIGKFILIGDYKQLPAIALQRADEAAVTAPLLQAIGLHDCRNSLFERLYKKSGEAFRGILRKQGRMHPAISDFPNKAFYHNERLEPVPLPHQEEECPYLPTRMPHDNLDRLLLYRRIAFIPAETPETDTTSDKANPQEARIVAILLERIYRLTGERFDAGKTVGVIVPYRNQITMIRKEISRLGIPPLSEVSIDTVERYQGSQRDVIIYSFTVRNLSQLNFLTASTFREGDFLIDRKLNVAMTRARKQLLLTGNPHILGANLTFYKLMEYIRMNNGYIDAAAERFCMADFDIPEHDKEWYLHPEIYPLSENFRHAYQMFFSSAPNPSGELFESIAYGRADFRSDGHNQASRVRAYNRLYLCRQYAAAQALYETFGNRLRTAINQMSGRIIFCDLACEAGASGMAFADICRTMPHTSLVYLGINPVKEMKDTAESLFQTEAYRHIPTRFAPRLSDIELEEPYAALPALVIINLSNLFDRIPPAEACQIARQINRLKERYPLHHYITAFRDDGGTRANSHSYTAFCCSLTESLRPLNEHMPYLGKFYYRESYIHAPHHEEFLYEIRTDRQTYQSL